MSDYAIINLAIWGGFIGSYLIAVSIHGYRNYIRQFQGAPKKYTRHSRSHHTPNRTRQ